MHRFVRKPATLLTRTTLAAGNALTSTLTSQILEAAESVGHDPWRRGQRARPRSRGAAR